MAGWEGPACPCSAQGQRKGCGIAEGNNKTRRQGPHCPGGRASEALDSGICFGLMMSSRRSGHAGGRQCPPTNPA